MQQGGMPPQQTPQGGQPPGGSQGGPQGQGGGVLNLQQIIPAVQKSLGPNADPRVFAAAVNKYLPLMTAQAQSQWKEAQMYLHQQQMQLGQERLQQGEERLQQGQQKWNEQRQQREQSLDVRKGQLDVQQRRLALQALEADRRWTVMQQRMIEAEKTGNRAEISVQLRALDNLVREKIAQVNAGKLPKEMAEEIKNIQAQITEAANEVLKQRQSRKPAAPEAGTPRLDTPNDAVQQRFPGQGDVSNPNMQ